MIQLLNWFQINYPYYKKDLLECYHNFDDKETNPYHIEGDCWSHTMMVCKIAQLKDYPKVVKISALLHDIGKPKARKINSQNNHIQFFGHEEISAELAKPLLDDLITREWITKSEKEEIYELIRLHGELYKHDEEYIYKIFQDKLELFIHLTQLADCDDLGRFSPTMGQKSLDIDSIIQKIRNNNRGF